MKKKNAAREGESGVRDSRGYERVRVSCQMRKPHFDEIDRRAQEIAPSGAFSKVLTEVIDAGLRSMGWKPTE